MSAINDFMNAGDVLDNAVTELLRLSPFTGSELAQRVGVSQPTVSRWHAGLTKPSVPNMILMCKSIDGRIQEIEKILDLLWVSDA